MCMCSHDCQCQIFTTRPACNLPVMKARHYLSSTVTPLFNHLRRWRASGALWLVRSGSFSLLPLPLPAQLRGVSSHPASPPSGEYPSTLSRLVEQLFRFSPPKISLKHSPFVTLLLSSVFFFFLSTTGSGKARENVAVQGALCGRAPREKLCDRSVGDAGGKNGSEEGVHRPGYVNNKRTTGETLLKRCERTQLR